MNMMFWSGKPDDDQRDSQIGSLLGELDPGRDDATYWLHFHGDVVEAARFELARRRREAELTVVGVVSSWSRALVPVALAAAAVAGIMLAEPDVDRGAPPMMMEEILSMGIADPLPALFVDEDDEVLLMALERY